MNEELRQAAQEVLAQSGESEEYRRRMLKLLENVTAGSYTDADVRQVIDLANVPAEE